MRRFTGDLPPILVSLSKSVRVLFQRRRLVPTKPAEKSLRVRSKLTSVTKNISDAHGRYGWLQVGRLAVDRVGIEHGNIRTAPMLQEAPSRDAEPPRGEAGNLMNRLGQLHPTALAAHLAEEHPERSIQSRMSPALHYRTHRKSPWTKDGSTTAGGFPRSDQN